ncbi:MAG: DUF5693 family protein, partial [Armatimonadota bacterium]|nr:DUF5693 family protein [Armatimonadota bacterium]
MGSLSRVWAAVILMSLVASGFVAARRVSVESRNRRVEIAVEWNEVRSLAGACRKQADEVLRVLRNHGVSSVAVSEMDLTDLRDAGRIFLQPSSPAPFAAASLLLVPDPTLGEQLVAHLNARRGRGTAVAQPASFAAAPMVVRLEDGYEALRATPVGLPPDAVDAVRAAGLQPVARVNSDPGADAAAIQWVMADVARKGIRTVVFAGTEVLGNKDLLPVTADAMRRNGLCYGFVEFGKQYGDATLARLTDGKLVRVHSITEPEMGRVTPPEAAERFAKAARERNVRLLYVRLFEQLGEDPLAANTRYLDLLGRQLRRGGLVTGLSRPYPPLHTPPPLLALVAAGIVAAGVLLMAQVFLLSARAQVACFVLGAAASTALLLFPPTENVARKADALLAALIFPTLSLFLFGAGKPRDAAPLKTIATWFTLKHLLWMSAVTLAGAALVAGMLADTRFLVKYDQFAGIKLAHVAPILAVGLMQAAGFHTPAAHWSERWERARARVARLLADPVYVWQLIALLTGMVLIAVVVMRSGNDAGVGVSPLELKFRSLLDRV